MQGDLVWCIPVLLLVGICIIIFSAYGIASIVAVDEKVLKEILENVVVVCCYFSVVLY